MSVHFRVWKGSCVRLWDRRGSLVRRFFRNLSEQSQNKKNSRFRIQRALSYTTGKRIHAAFKSWAYRTRQLARLLQSHKNNLKLTRFRQKKFTKYVFYVFARLTAVSKRLTACRRAATRHFVLRTTRNSLLKLHAVAAVTRMRRVKWVQAQYIISTETQYWNSVLTQCLHRTNPVVLKFSMMLRTHSLTHLLTHRWQVSMEVQTYNVRRLAAPAPSTT